MLTCFQSTGLTLTRPLKKRRALDNLICRGLGRYFGSSNFTAWQAAKFIGVQNARGHAPFIAAQMYYSLVGRDLEQEVVPFCQDAGVGIVVWSPLASGFLSGRYTRQDPTGGKGRLAEFDILHIDKERGYDLIGKLRDIASRYKATVAQIALAWLLAKPYVSTILLGASKLHQLDDNLGAAHIALSSDEIIELDKLTAPTPLYPNWFQTFAADAAVRAMRSEQTESPEAIYGENLYAHERNQESHSQRQRLQRMPRDARHLGSPPALSGVWPRRLL
jgi:aryl-alcohol dehydrogenase-like predicted oxidoreductase